MNLGGGKESLVAVPLGRLPSCLSSEAARGQPEIRDSPNISFGRTNENHVHV